MPLKTLSNAEHRYRNFVDFLVDENKLKPGFRQILRGRDLLEIDRYLNEKNLISKVELQQEYAKFFQLPFEHIINRPLRPETARLLPVEVAKKYKVVALSLENNTLTLAVGEPALLQKTAPHALLNLRRQKGLKVELVVVPETEVEVALKKLYPQETTLSQTANKPPTQSKSHEPTVSEKPKLENDFHSLPKTPPVPVMPKQPMATNKQDLIKEVEPRQTVDLTNRTIPQDVINKIPLSVAKKYKVIVFNYKKPKSQFEQPLIEVALVNPAEIHVLEILNYIEQRNKVLVKKYETSEESFTKALSQYQPEEKPTPAVPPIAKPVQQESKPNLAAPPPKTEKKEAEEELIDPRKLPRSAFPIKTDSSSPATVGSNSPVKEEPSGPAVQLKNVQVDEKDMDKIVESTAKTEGNKPTSELGSTLEDQNLDLLLKSPITTVEQLAEVYKRGLVPEMVAATLFLGIRMKASDVHIEAGQEHVRIRFRVDGVLHDIIKVPIALHAPVISRIKILSKMKIDEQRVPQDGRFDVIIDKHQVDLRVSTLPTVHGEKIVMRLLDKSQGIMTLEQLGVTGSNFDILIANIQKPYGVILSTGPTGSGKSTTLYAVLSRISKPGVNIITLEDPVEYDLPGINQAQVKPGIGFTFAEGLRSVLRQDPNVIMVGEIRDLETAAMATHAALTGHLVLSTLHTNDASGALPRLINMGVEPFLITSSLNAVVGQRLVRKVCDNCREKIELPPAVKNFVKDQLSLVPSGQLKDLNLEDLTFYHGKGCSQCTNGYRGRIGIFEVLPMTEMIEELAVKKAPASEIKRAAIESGMITMTQDGLIKALKGITTVDEVMRVTTAESKEVPGG